MKKYIFALIFLTALQARATTLTGTVNYPNSAGLTGTIYFALSQQGAQLSTGGCGGPAVIVPTAQVSFPITAGTIAGGAQVVGNDCIAPANTYYIVQVKDSNNNTLFQQNWSITGTSENIGSILPVIVANGTLTIGSAYITNLIISGSCTLLGQVCFGGGGGGGSGIINPGALGDVPSYLSATTLSDSGIPANVIAKFSTPSCLQNQMVYLSSFGTTMSCTQSMTFNPGGNPQVLLRGVGNGNLQYLQLGGTPTAPVSQLGAGSTNLSLFGVSSGTAVQIGMAPGSNLVMTAGLNNTFQFAGTTGYTSWCGSTSGCAGIGVSATAGTPNTLLLPTTTGTSGQVLQTNGANPQQLSWATPTLSGSGAATNLSYWSGASALSNVLGTAVTAGTGAVTMTAGADTTNPLSIAGHSSTQSSPIFDASINSATAGLGFFNVRGFGINKWSDGGGTILAHFMEDGPVNQAPVGWVVSNNRSGYNSNGSPHGAISSFCSDAGICSIAAGGTDSNGNYSSLIFDPTGKGITVGNSDNNNGNTANFTVDTSQTTTHHDIVQIQNSCATTCATVAAFDQNGLLYWNGTTSGTAKIGVAAIAGTPCVILLPTTSPTAGQFLQSAAPSSGNCQASWATPAGGGSGITACTTTGGVGFENGTSNTLTCDSGLTYSTGAGSLTVGSTTTGKGTVNLVGSTSGTAAIQVAAVAGSPAALQLPTATGSSGQFLQTNGSSPQQLSWVSAVQLICSGQITLSTGAISSGTRATNTLSCTGLSTSTDSISCTFSGDTNAVTGYAPSSNGGLTIKTWVSANTINADQVNDTAASITPGAATLNCKGLR